MKEFLEYVDSVSGEEKFIDVDSIKLIKVFKDNDASSDSKILNIAYGDGNESLEISEKKNPKEYDDLMSQVRALRPDAGLTKKRVVRK